MNYYVLQDDEIAFFDTDKSRLQTTLKFKPELADAKIHQTTKEIVELDGRFVFADEYQEEIEAQKEQKEDEENQQILDHKIDELIKEMAKADLMGDEDWKTELREQYNALLETEDEE